MFKKITVFSMCAMLLLGVNALAAGEIPQGNPPSNMEMPDGMPPEGMELPEGIEIPEGMGRPDSMPGNTQAEGVQPSEEATENVEAVQEQTSESEQASDETTENVTKEQGQNTNRMTPPDMNFGGGMPGGFSRGNVQAEAEPMTFTRFINEYQTPIISIALLIVAFVFVKLYRRKNY